MVLSSGNCVQVIQWLLISIDLPGHFPSMEPLGQVVYLTIEPTLPSSHFGSQHNVITLGLFKLTFTIMASNFNSLVNSWLVYNCHILLSPQDCCDFFKPRFLLTLCFFRSLMYPILFPQNSSLYSLLSDAIVNQLTCLSS